MDHDDARQRLIDELRAMQRSTRRARLMPGADARDDSPLHGWWVRDDDEGA